MTPDINVLVAASRADHPHHPIAFGWLQQALVADNSERFELLPMVASGYLRIVTNARVFPDPTPIEHAISFLDALLEQQHVEFAVISGEWPLLRGACIAGNLTGNAIPDAWIAASVRVLKSKLATFDRGFVRLLESHQLEVLPAQT